MPVREVSQRPVEYAQMPDGYLWLECFDEKGVYGVAAVRPVAEVLELHMSARRWGAGVLRSLRGDLDWLRGWAGRRGISEIVVFRTEDDARWRRFVELLGFGGYSTVQVARMEVDHGA